MEHQDYKNESIEKRYLDNMQNNQFLKVKNSLLELEKYFTEWADTELKDRKEEKLKKTEKLFNKPIIVTKVDMDMFEEQELKKIRSWFDRLIKQKGMENKPKIIRDKLNDKIIRGKWTLFQQKKKKRKKGIREREKKNNEKIIKDKIIRDIRTLFAQEGEDYYQP